MAHESFENPAITAVMNELFVNIKVGREGRPVIDHANMSALRGILDRTAGSASPLTAFVSLPNP